MVILSRVCADFYDKNGVLLHRITRRDLGNFRIAPDSIKQDPLFQMLVDDGSIKYPADDAKDKALEQDPFAGVTADGKEIKQKVAPKTKAKTKPKTETKPEAKPETKAEERPEEKTTETK